MRTSDKHKYNNFPESWEIHTGIDFMSGESKWKPYKLDQGESVERAH